MNASIFKLIQNYVQDHLVKTRGLSSNTVLSYKATIKLLLHFIAKSKKKKISSVKLADLKSKNILNFLEHVEIERGCSISTRNQRLAVIKSFCSYLLQEELSISDDLQKIKMLRMKKDKHRPFEYLTEAEVKAVLDIFDTSTDQGIRDKAIFTLMYNTGARASELCGLKLKDIGFDPPHKAKIHGKGQKIRNVPLWKETVKIVGVYLETRKNLDDSSSVFIGKHGQPLSRHGLLYLVKSWIKKAEVAGCKTLKNRLIRPHSLRHTTAMHLLQSGVDIAVIKSWLGHVDLNTTHGYIEINLKMKRTALGKLGFAHHTKNMTQILKENKDVLKWLDDL
jgi:site-specific recombinase XerD